MNFFFKSSSLQSLSFVSNRIGKSRYDWTKNTIGQNIKANLITLKKLLGFNLILPGIMKSE
jgi:hypothetical protein